MDKAQTTNLLPNIVPETAYRQNFVAIELILAELMRRIEALEQGNGDQ